MEIQTIDAKAKLLVEENRIMLIDLSLREQEQRVWFEKKQPPSPTNTIFDRTYLL
jgi:hypothetical protein